MKTLTIVAVTVLLASTTLANARTHSHRHHTIDANGNEAQVVAHPANCPRTNFCGCGVSAYIHHGTPRRDEYQARAYYKYPRDPNGNVAIFGRHHVAVILENYHDGTAKVYDPNNGGHRTRIHVRNIRGATIVRAS